MTADSTSKKLIRKFRYAALGVFALGCSAGPGDSLTGEDATDPTAEEPEVMQDLAAADLSNMSFETNVKGWYAWQGSLARAVISDAPDGKAAAKVTRTTGTKYSIGASPVVASIPTGASYTATAMVKAASGSAVGKVATLYIRERKNGANVKSWASAKVKLSSAFQKLSVTTQGATAGNVLDIYVAQDSAVAGDAFYADAFTFGLVNSPPAPVADAGTPAAPDPIRNTTTLFGASFDPHNAAMHDSLNAAWGGQMQVSRTFGGTKGVDPFINTFQALDISRNAVSAYSFKYLPLEVLAGQHDAAFTKFFQAIKDDHPVYWTYWHEPDDELYADKTFTPKDYRAAWAHIKKIADGVKATRPKMIAYATPIIMAWSMTQANRPLLGDDGMYPGDDVVDIFGVDVYNLQAQNKGVNVDVAAQYKIIIDFAEAHGKKWAIGEIGSCPVKDSTTLRAKYLSDSIAYWKLRGNFPVYAAYFNLDWPSCDFRIENDPLASAVWKQAVTKGVSSF